MKLYEFKVDTCISQTKSSYKVIFKFGKVFASAVIYVRMRLVTPKIIYHSIVAVNQPKMKRKMQHSF